MIHDSESMKDFIESFLYMSIPVQVLVSLETQNLNLSFSFYRLNEVEWGYTGCTLFVLTEWNIY